MPNTPLATAAAKRRHWHKALAKCPQQRVRSPQTVLSVSARPLAALLECAPDGDALMLSDDDDDDDDRAAGPCIAQKLPTEMMELVLGMLDGDSLLACALVCRALAQLTFDRDVWRNICMQRWPTLRTQLLAQLPGAPDYDLIRLYGGCWRRCFVEKHRKNARAELHVEIPKFPALSALAVEKIVSETFAIGEHRFCLWIFPNGNPNEQQYAGKVLSAYLVLTDLDRRPPGWLTCAVFSLSVTNHVDPAQRIEWHSCLVDNKFDGQLNNWGVHSLGALKTLKNPANGFLRHDALTVTARVRLMTITFRPMFGSLLCDGVDIDAYSFCQLYVESAADDDAPLDTGVVAPPVAALPTTTATTSLPDASLEVPAPANAYIFVKILNPSTNQLQYIGRIRFVPRLASGAIYECVAKRLGCVSSEMALYKEEIAPTRLLESRYARAEALLQSATAAVPTLEAVETLAEQLDIPKFRVRSAFRKCREDARRTLKYIMEGRHLGFICDSCGETDFKGPRFNCAVCTDYDLCHACNAQCHEVNHRYANVDGKWQRIYNFKDHGVTHPMREMKPVFFQYDSSSSSRNTGGGRAGRQHFACCPGTHHTC
ncbi:hypothetical protein PybrP1_011722 [[Pythium] brassicae (nom. inval.)]|nr:hypothetical protein PybrP1_011722 [[Pythium] brassicae (nom. inval.)]